MVLAKGNAFKYIIPSFPDYNAKIFEVKLQWEEKCEDGSSKLHVFYGFAQLCEDLDHYCTFIVQNFCSHKIKNFMLYTYIQANEFSRSMDITPYECYGGHEVFI